MSVQTLPFRRTLQELVEIHRREPTLRDVIVEGPSDQALWTWFLSRAGLRNVVVYPITAFDVPNEQVAALPHELNNRGRVIAVSAAVSVALAGANAVACIIDRDLDGILGDGGLANEYLFRTDFSCHEMYTFRPEVLDKFVGLLRIRAPLTGAQFLDKLAPILLDRFAYRVANKSLNLSLQQVPWLRCVTLNGDQLAFDDGEFTSRCLNKNNKTKDADAFNEERQQRRAGFTDDRRHYIHGHDFLELLVWVLKKPKGAELRDEEQLQRELYLALEFSDLENTALFSSVLNRFASKE